jgi:hypothetical protein
VGFGFGRDDALQFCAGLAVFGLPRRIARGFLNRREARRQLRPNVPKGRFYQPDIFAEIGDTKRPCLAFG